MPAQLTAWLDTLARLHVLEGSQLEDARRMAANASEPKGLAANLIQRGWLSAFQANLLLRDRGEELLLGSYVLLDKLGEGGMGAVYRARNWKLGRITAIKLIRKELLASPDAVRRFYREIRAAAQLEHVNVVRAYDADEVHGTHFFAMEYVEGVDLARLVREHGPVPSALACEYIRQAALGLQHAHERGLVHRDIKPANLLLARGSGPGIVKLLDMGLARLDETAAAEETGTLTQVGMVMGTPDYMAPEQSVSARTVDIRADLYSLGCSLYFLLTGAVPFPGGSLTAKLLKHQLDEPTPIEMLRPDVPGPVADVVYRLMAKKPEDRFQTPRELADVLQALLVGQTFPPAKTQPPGGAIKKGISDKAELANPFWADIVARTADRTLASKPQMPWRFWTVVGAAALLLGVAVIVLLRGRGAPQRALASKPSGNPPAAFAVTKLTPLFSANNLNGFKTAVEASAASDGMFRIENSVLMVTGKPKGYLYSDNTYRNYHLSCEVRHPNVDSNTGVFLHIQEPHVVWPRAIELQGYYRDLGRLFGLKRTGGQFTFDLEAQARALKPVGEWNHLEVSSSDGRLVSKLNGVTVSEGWSDLSEGAIGFQSEWSEVRFRNIRISEPAGSSAPVDGFVPLFNGTDLTGWTNLAGGTANWQVADGALTDAHAAGRDAYLYSERGDWGDFHLRAEVKVGDGANGGIYFRAAKPVAVVGDSEAQLNNSRRDPQKTGGLYNRVRVSEQLVPPNEWFIYEIHAEGNHLQLFVNGQKTADIRDTHRATGHIVLQHLTGPVYFRKIDIRETGRKQTR